MAVKLHSLNILHSTTFKRITNWKRVSNVHLASILVQELSHDLKKQNIYRTFLNFLKREHILMYESILRQSKCVKHKIYLIVLLFIIQLFYHVTCNQFKMNSIELRIDFFLS